MVSLLQRLHQALLDALELQHLLLETGDRELLVLELLNVAGLTGGRPPELPNELPVLLLLALESRTKLEIAFPFVLLLIALID